MRGSESEVAEAERIFQFGRRRSELFIGPIQFEKGHNRRQDGGVITGDPRYLGLLDSNALTSTAGHDIKSLIKLLRHKLQRNPGIRCADYLIQYIPKLSRKRRARHSGGRHQTSRDTEMVDDDDDMVENPRFCYATVSPTWDADFHLITKMKPVATDGKLSRMHHRWLSKGSRASPPGECIHRLDSDRLRIDGFDILFTDDQEAVQSRYSWVFGTIEVAAVFVKEGSTPIAESNFHIEDFLHCHENDLLSHAKIVEHVMTHNIPSPVAKLLSALSRADYVYKELVGATVSLKCFEKPLIKSKWYEWHLSQPGTIQRKLALAIVSYFDSGSCDLDPSDLDEVIAVSSGDSIYVPEQVSNSNIFLLPVRQSGAHLFSISGRRSRSSKLHSKPCYECIGLIFFLYALFVVCQWVKGTERLY
jgi:hypothetical protein